MEEIMKFPSVMKRRQLLAGGAGLAVSFGPLARPAIAATKSLKIGVCGVMSGAAASWGLTNKYCALATAKMYNDQGGFEIGGDKYHIAIFAIDDQNDPKLSVAGIQRLTEQDGVHYIIGPNVDTTAVADVPALNAAQAMNIPYAFSKWLYTKPQENSILGMIASYQAGPIIYSYLMKNKGVKTVSFVAANATDALGQRKEGIDAANKLGLKVLSSNVTYEPGTTDFFPIMSKPVHGKPDLIVLSGVAPADAPLLIRAARQLGFKGILSTETAQDIKVLNQGAGKDAEGFISVGGASTPAIRSAYMESFVKQYSETAGAWNDEAGTKVYELEMILRTLAVAGPAAITDASLFKKAIDTFETPNPFLKDKSPLRYVGTAYFGQKRQIGVPLVVNEVKDGAFQTLFVGSVS
jgi:branched-chain amino acid transport system substrate-binding protein